MLEYVTPREHRELATVPGSTKVALNRAGTRCVVARPTAAELRRLPDFELLAELRLAAANAFSQAHELGSLVEDLVT